MLANNYYWAHRHMETNTAATQLAALAQPTRLDIFRALVVAGDSGLSAGALADRLNVSPQALSFHLKELRYAALVGCESQGRFVIYRARYDTMNALLAFLTKNCCAQSMSNRESVCCEPAMAHQSVVDDVNNRFFDTSKP